MHPSQTDISNKINMIHIFYLFFAPIVAALAPYLACSILDIPYLHGFFSIDMYILFCLLLLPRKNIIYSSIWILILFFYSLYYEQSLSATITLLHHSTWSDLFCALIYLIFVMLAFIIPRKLIFILTFTATSHLLLFLADASNILFMGFNIKLFELWNLASFFIWGIPLFIAIPCIQVILVLFFSRKIFLNNEIKKWHNHPITFILCFLFILILNWGINSLQSREKIISSPLKDYSLIFDKEDNPSKNHFLNPDIKAAYPIYKKNDLHAIDDKYDKVIMILVESWGVPKNIDLLRASFQILDSLPSAFIGLYPRKTAYTQGAEWEDFGIPNGVLTDSVLPAKYKRAGYETWYVHGFDKKFFDRAMTYPDYGFDSLLFQDDFKKRGLKGCQYGYPGICDASLELWLEQKIEEPGKKFIYWTTLDAHYPYDNQTLEKRSKLCDEFALSGIACVFWTHEEETLQSIAKLVKKFPNVHFIIRGDHRPMGIGKLNYTDFIESFYIYWVPVLIFN